MARRIQSQPGHRQSGVRTFLGLLANAVFWLIAAMVLPIEAFIEAAPGLAPYAGWAPVLCYALAFWSFIRAMRVLKGVAGGRMASLIQAPVAGAAGDRSATNRRDKPQVGLPVTRTPTVQRMR